MEEMSEGVEELKKKRESSRRERSQSQSFPVRARPILRSRRDASTEWIFLLRLCVSARVLVCVSKNVCEREIFQRYIRNLNTIRWRTWDISERGHVNLRIPQIFRKIEIFCGEDWKSFPPSLRSVTHLDHRVYQRRRCTKGCLSNGIYLAQTNGRNLISLTCILCAQLKKSLKGCLKTSHETGRKKQWNWERREEKEAMKKEMREEEGEWFIRERESVCVREREEGTWLQ